MRREIGRRRGGVDRDLAKKAKHVVGRLKERRPFRPAHSDLTRLMTPVRKKGITTIGSGVEGRGEQRHRCPDPRSSAPISTSATSPAANAKRGCSGIRPEVWTTKSSVWPRTSNIRRSTASRMVGREVTGSLGKRFCREALV